MVLLRLLADQLHRGQHNLHGPYDMVESWERRGGGGGEGTQKTVQPAWPTGCSGGERTRGETQRTAQSAWLTCYGGGGGLKGGGGDIPGWEGGRGGDAEGSTACMAHMWVCCTWPRGGQECVHIKSAPSHATMHDFLLIPVMHDIGTHPHKDKVAGSIHPHLL